MVKLIFYHFFFEVFYVGNLRRYLLCSSTILWLLYTMEVFIRILMTPETSNNKNQGRKFATKHRTVTCTDLNCPLGLDEEYVTVAAKLYQLVLKMKSDTRLLSKVTNKNGKIHLEIWEK